jgi:hypothetical protein
MSSSYLTVRDAAELTRFDEPSKQFALESFIKLLEHKIRTTATVRIADTIWVVPSFMPDLPPYDAEAMAEQLAKHFSGQGFYTKVLKDTIYVSWRYAAGKKTL